MKIEAHTFRSVVRVPWTLRWRVWRLNRKLTKAERDIVARATIALEQACLFGAEEGS